MNKRGGAALALIAMVLALIILAFYLVNVNSRECNGNEDCSLEAYCGNDYKCHDFPDQVVVKENSFILAAIILGASMIIAALIFRKGKRKEKEENY